jgi:hypothetical protein
MTTTINSLLLEDPHTPVMYVRSLENILATQSPLSHTTGEWSVSAAFAILHSKI